MKTTMLKPAEVQSKWWIIDGEDLVVGRLAAKLAPILMGKHRPDYTPHVLCGDFVIVTNAEKVKFTGMKWEDKTYDRYTGYPGGRRVVTASTLRDKAPEKILELAVRRMLPKNKLASRMLKRLKVYAGTDHPHQAQQPEPLKIDL
ncbi:50S ribosomal protein L13 [Planctomycetes bacterium Pan216]